jgi:hypothetical protein
MTSSRDPDMAGFVTGANLKTDGASPHEGAEPLSSTGETSDNDSLPTKRDRSVARRPLQRFPQRGRQALVVGEKLIKEHWGQSGFPSTISISG